MIAHIGALPLEELLPVLTGAGSGLLVVRAWIVPRALIAAVAAISLARVLERRARGIALVLFGAVFGASLGAMVADMHRGTERSRRAREVPGRLERRSGFRPWLALRLPRVHADPRAAR